MYLDYFSLQRHPFRITPDPSLFFPGGQDGRGVILNALIYGINSGEGILKVVGEVGSGKTMLCRMLEEELPDSVEIVYIANPSLSAREILYAIAIELKLDLSASTERLKVLHLIQDYLLNKHAQGGTVVVFIEEAQSMPLETLEEIRLLSNLETHQNKLMQIVLFGQPELDKILSQKNIRQLKERITHSFSLAPLSAGATSEYIRYRLKAAGCPRSGLFSRRAEKMIAKASSGLTRRINILADKSLLAAYADSPSRQPPENSKEALVLPRHVKAAIKDSDYKTNYDNRWLFGGVGLSAVLILALFIGGRFLWSFLDGADMPVIPQVAVQDQRSFQQAEQNANNAVVVGNENVLDVNDGSSAQQTVERSGASAGEIAEGLILREPINDESDSSIAAVLREVDSDARSTNEINRTPVVTETAIPESNESAALTRLSPDNPVENRLPSSDEGLSSSDGPVSDPGEIVDVVEIVDETVVEEVVEDINENIPEESVAAVNETIIDETTDEATDETIGQTLGQTIDEPVPASSVPAARVERETSPVVLARQGSQAGEIVVPQAPVAVVPSGLAELRMQPTAEWLSTLADKTGYSLVLFSVPSTNPNGLEEYLQFLQLLSLLDDTYICFRSISSEASGRWQVMHKEFEGVTPAKNFINSLPVYIQQYDPYVSNLDRIECSYPVEINN